MIRQHSHLRTVAIHGEEVIYRLRRSKKARHIIIRVDIQEGVELVVPWHVSFRMAEQFVEKKRGWISRTLRKHKLVSAIIPQRQLRDGEILPCFGNVYRLSVHVDTSLKKLRTYGTAGTIVVKAPSLKNIRPAVEGWYNKRAAGYFAAKAHTVSALLGVSCNAIRVRNMKTQWGSCNVARSTITLNWRLALAPLEVADYVAIHEVVHLKERAHSERFWDIVQQLDPLYKQHKNWLRAYGHTLVL